MEAILLIADAIGVILVVLWMLKNDGIRKDADVSGIFQFKIMKILPKDQNTTAAKPLLRR